MGACLSAPDGNKTTEQDRILHREAEKQLREVSLKLPSSSVDAIGGTL